MHPHDPSRRLSASERLDQGLDAEAPARALQEHHGGGGRSGPSGRQHGHGHGHAHPRSPVAHLPTLAAPGEGVAEEEVGASEEEEEEEDEEVITLHPSPLPAAARRRPPALAGGLGGSGGGPATTATDAAVRGMDPPLSLTDAELERSIAVMAGLLGSRGVTMADGGAKLRRRVGALQAEVAARRDARLGGAGSLVGRAAPPAGAAGAAAPPVDQGWLAQALGNSEEAWQARAAAEPARRTASHAACVFCGDLCPVSAMAPLPPALRAQLGPTVAGSGAAPLICESCRAQYDSAGGPGGRRRRGGTGGGACGGGGAGPATAAVPGTRFYGGDAGGGGGVSGSPLPASAAAAAAAVGQKRRRRPEADAAARPAAGRGATPMRRRCSTGAAPPLPVAAPVVSLSSGDDDDDDDDGGGDNAGEAGAATATGPLPPALARAPQPARPRPGRGRGGPAAAAAAARAVTLAALAGLRAVYPAPGTRSPDPTRPVAGPGGRVTLTPADVATLDPGEMLGDAAMEFQLRRIVDGLPPHIASRFYVFSPFFWGKLTGENGTGAAGRRGGGGGAGEEEVGAATLAHARVAAWTKGVDLFAKDFLIIPIHGDLHWSLLVIAHPAGVAHGGGPAALDAARAAIAANRDVHRPPGARPIHPEDIPAPPRPTILHLDSMGGAGGHATPGLAKAGRGYLLAEWRAKGGCGRGGVGGSASSGAPALPPPPPGTPMSVAAAVAAVSPPSTDWAAQFAHRRVTPAPPPGPPAPGASPPTPGIAHRRVSPLPCQDNGSDCGAFVLAYADFFTHCAPDVLPSGSHTDLAAIAARPDSPGFLQGDWFPARPTTGALRASMRAAVLHALHAQAPHAGLGPEAAPVLTALSEAAEVLGPGGPVGAGGGPYHGPRCHEWLGRGQCAQARKAATLSLAGDGTLQTLRTRPTARLPPPSAAAAAAAELRADRAAQARRRSRGGDGGGQCGVRVAALDPPAPAPQPLRPLTRGGAAVSGARATAAGPVAVSPPPSPSPPRGGGRGGGGGGGETGAVREAPPSSSPSYEDGTPPLLRAAVVPPARRPHDAAGGPSLLPRSAPRAPDFQRLVQSNEWVVRPDLGEGRGGGGGQAGGGPQEEGPPPLQRPRTFADRPPKAWQWRQ